VTDSEDTQSFRSGKSVDARQFLTGHKFLQADDATDRMVIGESGGPCLTEKTKNSPD
jgi:hypothetical protein